MTLLDSILEFNKSFVDNKEYEAYETSKQPSKKSRFAHMYGYKTTRLIYESFRI